MVNYSLLNTIIIIIIKELRKCSKNTTYIICPPTSAQPSAFLKPEDAIRCPIRSRIY